MTGAGDRLFADDLVVGSTYRFTPHVVDEEEILDFARRWDPQWFHLDPAAAADGPFHGLIASGIHTLAICHRLSVLAALDRWRVIAGRELRSVRFRRPVRPGMTLGGRIAIDGIDASRPDRALVTSIIEVTDTAATATDAVVLSGTLDMYVARRPADETPASA